MSAFAQRRAVAAREHGFTLLELIVAAGILALIAVFSWRGLDALIREREALAASQAVIDVMQRSFARIERDALLAGDVELDGDGSMRLVAGTASADGTPAATVDYRLRGGTLTRSVEGVDRVPLVMMEDVAAIGMEAWAPAQRGGGSWVRTRRAVAPTPAAFAPNAANPNAQAAGAQADPAVATAAAAAQPSAPGAAAAQPSEGTPPSGTAQQAPNAAPPAVATATGIRLTLARADGSRIVRDFVVGGG